MKTEFANSAFKSLSKLEKSLTAQLRRDAVTAGWPRELARTLTVQVAKNEITVSYPETLSGAIEDLEYGDGSTSPKPVFRRFIDKHQTMVQDTLSEWSIDYLFENEVLP